MLNFSLGSAFPGKSVEDAMGLASGIQEVPVLGEIGLDHVQICPQNYKGGVMGLARLQALQTAYPNTQFRFHANVRILEKGCQYDLGTADQFPEYTEKLVESLDYLGQPYSLHAAENGRPLASQIKVAKQLSAQAGVPVAIEGLYPGHRNNTLATWADWERLLEMEASYALDFSHMNIILSQSGGPVPVKLMEDLLASPNCLEIHFSGNNGERDSHQVCQDDEWWLDFLPLIRDETVCFYEGRTR
ncbi:hypothetical protein A6M27_10290 [Acidithiobacillus thiooxidans]|uniref:Xylose isomerase-like TIM barrel domain-containing protein n=1 Tax=Acidithiobacillus thiooxidans TaxID=930 RepID=A0A1C2HWB1_ACITH|nr:hypothetical protein [Acidithiobacillus thiooxidans]OCX67980.1 hypothetical protein A6P07_19035 [Acidithiobacillus thiooxidans]OCX73413.1 hypothetical protein A6O24_11455 [Acidithiobacillus thiooxidans]OCX83722.1 hypothetical protein A6O26_06415 [Acidithiobacillus thiooxidans]OCX87628.1 hypothetical protein A6M27_10290 [Acidithiobacillus thiooxidans]OFC43635.1 hypothetical protein BAE47_12710 [Acidithiobacillus thiooxidans]